MVKIRSIRFPYFGLVSVLMAVFLIGGIFACQSDKKSKKNKSSKSEDFTYVSTGISGFSGICLGKTPDTYLALSDRNGLYEISEDGSINRRINALGYQDMEGICINTSNNQVYLVEETQMRVYRLSEDEKTLELFINVVVPQGESNKGIEGIACGKDTLYVVNQDAPPLLIKYSLTTGKEVQRTELNFAGFLSDIFYDNTDGTLWIADSKKQKIFHCDRNGEVIDDQNISFVKKPEALMVDRKSNVAWVGCDETGYLYKVKLKI
jgi:uncharacterized protein YjiK